MKCQFATLCTPIRTAHADKALEPVPESLCWQPFAGNWVLHPPPSNRRNRRNWNPPTRRVVHVCVGLTRPPLVSDGGRASLQRRTAKTCTANPQLERVAGNLNHDTPKNVTLWNHLSTTPSRASRHSARHRNYVHACLVGVHVLRGTLCSLIQDALVVCVVCIVLCV